MRLRPRPGLSLALTLLASASASAPALAQPQPQPQPQQPPQPADQPGSSLAAFEKELDALFAAGGLTADQAASRAPAASPSVRKAAASIDVAYAQAEAAELVRVPRVAASATYTRLSPIDPIVLGMPGMAGAPAITFPVNGYGTQAQLGIALSDYLVRYPKLIEAARLGIEATRVSKRANEIGAGQDARIAYYEWVRAKLQVLIANRQLVQIRSTLGQVRAFAEVGRLTNADRMRVESQEAQAEQVLDQLKYLAELREEQLRLLIGAAPGEPLAVGEDVRLDIPVPPAEQLDQLLAAAKLKRLEFRALDVGIRAKEKQRESEKANLYPKVSAFATADYARPNQRVFLEADQFKLTWQVGLQASWTLNDHLVSRVTDKRLAAEARELRADRENLERGTRIAVLAAQQAVATAQSALATSQKGLAAAQEVYRVRQELLAKERGTAIELVDAETELTRARIAALNARVDLRVALAQLSHALGNDVK